MAKYLELMASSATTRLRMTKSILVLKKSKDKKGVGVSACEFWLEKIQIFV